jgi:hypothetical protein
VTDKRRMKARKAKKITRRDNTVVMPALRRIFKDTSRAAGKRKLN